MTGYRFSKAAPEMKEEKNRWYFYSLVNQSSDAFDLSTKHSYEYILSSDS